MSILRQSRVRDFKPTSAPSNTKSTNGYNNNLKGGGNGIWSDRTRPGPFVSNQNTPSYKLRESKRWCTRCGMGSHQATNCRIYPPSNTNGVNYQLGKDTMARYTKEGSNPYTSHSVSSVDASGPTHMNNQGFSSVNSAEIYERAMYFDGVLSINAVRQYNPHYKVPFVLQSNDMSSGIAGKGLIDSGATKTYISRRFVEQHNLNVSLLPIVNMVGESMGRKISDGKKVIVAIGMNDFNSVKSRHVMLT
ncbi:hypothetical protein SeLEV6574_g07681, partial [Synchytrium endobioticum]